MEYPLSSFWHTLYYHCCSECQLIFTTAFDDWTSGEFLQNIYNDDYILVDPEYTGARSDRNLQIILDVFNLSAHHSILDFGGGSGYLAKLLREKGLDAESWDPFSENNILDDQKKYDLVVSFEVFEHTPTPYKTVELALSKLKEQGIFFFSTTLLPPETIAKREMDGYIAPRNGHVTIYTEKALAKLFAPYGYQVEHFNRCFHLARKI
ncbi:class I SAM-dependent methyltransferase [Haemophilus paracuniculus]|uniref:class I SAM-dependent methyltransferase n=1 Tax=Haemophilus paracuniculus TaxID=734 RepID=UPI000992A4F3|nr:class I SAM-dependent methyltransferase [Haemophilus paracuniculus]